MTSCSEEQYIHALEQENAKLKKQRDWLLDHIHGCPKKNHVWMDDKYCGAKSYCDSDGSFFMDCVKNSKECWEKAIKIDIEEQQKNERN